MRCDGTFRYCFAVYLLLRLRVNDGKLAGVPQTTEPVTSWRLVGWLEFNVPFQHKYGYIRDKPRGEVKCKSKSTVARCLTGGVFYVSDGDGRGYC